MCGELLGSVACYHSWWTSGRARSRLGTDGCTG